ncbi:MAG: hypothetical protein NT004_16515 [Bacteroidetes bacterium]|nr:hypothetical protein [Bacteroidota bacterium]
MKTIQKIIVFYLLLTPIIGMAETKEIPFTLDDRDRIIRTEQKVESAKTEMNARFDQLFNFLWVIIGIFTTMMVSIFGFAFWDRKLSLAPIKKENQRIVSALLDFAKSHPKLTESLKNAGLM